MKKLILITLLLLFFQNAMFQIDANNSEWMQYIEELINEEETDNELVENLFDELSRLVENPYNLHTVTKEELEKLPFLSDIQIENLLYYIYKYTPLVDIHELKNVEELDLQTITYLLLFVYIGDTETSQQTKSKKYIRQNLMLRTNFTVQEKSGYKKENKSENPSKYYLGDPYYLSFRYEMNYQDKILLGIAGEKDPGERFPSPHTKAFDYHTFNLTLRNQGILEELHLGNYRLGFGQGLVLNNNFSMGKTSDVTKINQLNNGIRRHISTNESQFFSGAAGRIRWNDFQINLFYSHRNHDANADSSTISSFKTDGLNRTYNDLLKIQTAQIEIFGSHIAWRNDNLSLGLTAVYYSFGGKELNPDLRAYNLFYLRDKNHFNVGMNYLYQKRRMSVHGEIALDKSGKAATIHNFFFKPISFMDWIVSFRHYDKEYNAFYGKSFSESTAVQNETGLYLGTKFYLLRRWEMAAYWDYFTFPWLKYGINTPSSGNDFLIHLKQNLNSNLQMNWRYRYREKYKNINQEDKKVTATFPYEQHQWRYQLNYKPNKKLSFQMRMDYRLYKNEFENFTGKSLSQSFSYIPKQNKFQLDGGIAYFHTDNWDTRINVYEKNVLYAFSFVNYYGKGLRYYSVVKWNVSKPLTFYLKAASTHYFDRNTIGSGLEEIQGKEKTDLYFLLRYNF
jgi:hypothetical protein